MSKKKNIYVITYEINQYDQEGEYFYAAFLNEPKLAELSQLFFEKTIDELEDEQILFLSHVKSGGGRKHNEHLWYNMHFVNEGKLLSNG